MALKMMMADLGSFEGVLAPAGLGARDSLRLEAAMALYGHEITEEIDPLSAGLDFAVKLEKGERDPAIGTFIGQDALRAIAAAGPRHRLAGLVLDSPRSARQGMSVTLDGSAIGEVTSGCLSPTLGKSIAMAYVDAPHASPGGTVQVDLGRQTVSATTVALPFYKRI
jgi:aminomethyltransferase